MKCHYETLGVTKDATDEEIKKSYRKLALQWHPDKNRDRVDECTKQFHLIQQAYEVLVDPQERAWYDKHREAILRGGLGQGDKYQDSCLDVYQFFNASCYTGFSDDDQGFYAVYGDVFKKIGEEDKEYTEGDSEAPSFGTSQSSYDEVVGPFYAYWEGYCTARSYVWAEKFDTREAPNRQVRRVIEQENKKFRDKARKERNDEVRALVGFVRKRDKRVQLYRKKLEERAVEITRLAEEKKKRDRQQRLKDVENYKESNWSSMSELEHQLQALEAHVAEQFGDVLSSDEDEDEDGVAAAGTASGLDRTDLDPAIDDDLYYDSLYCVACNKAFKSVKALDNHNRSKKHLENVDRLQLAMAADDEQMTASEAKDNEDDDDRLTSNDEVPPPVEIASKSRSKKQKKKQKQKQKLQNSMLDSDDEVENQNEMQHNTTAIGELMPHHDATTRIAAVENGSQEGEASEKTSQSEDVAKSRFDSTSEPSAVDASPTSATVKTKLKKNIDQKNPANDSEQSTHYNCNKCSKSFVTRNKLFDHIKATGHALHVDPNTIDLVGPDTTAAGKKRKEKKSGRR